MLKLNDNVYIFFKLLLLPVLYSQRGSQNCKIDRLSEYTCSKQNVIIVNYIQHAIVINGSYLERSPQNICMGCATQLPL